ncbi:anthranilate synthase component I family protein [Coriobacteriia bacterium Es71-Z0120]|uniref:chorismate-binding protein n=1 Tax=Parvivirga hydrogeniphila TaxID=2939460 RepID=UPI002260DB01|nr:anthranilate synthase component I family protein [Parvivirga hydrogeniphila]MCL4078114.1 anthranilate synthase component I family protein [Parvivirga hydrogeniphila]
MLQDILTAGGVVLAPAGAEGWFGGTALVAASPVEHRPACGLREAAELLERVFRGCGSALAVAVLPYDGTPEVALFEHVVPAADVAWPTPLPADLPLLAEPYTDMGREEYMAAVDALHERIRGGDVYVANLTRRITGRLAHDSAIAFSTLLARGAGAMSAFVVLPDGRMLASVSPERFVRLRDELEGVSVEVWPIKGTRPRGRTASEDRALAADLVACEKERAEHTMIVDLERNDIGRVALPGSVVVRSLRSVVPTPYCWQMVSCVRGLLCADVPVAAVLEAAFPCGSVTGAPKRAAMRVISELERSTRGAYCGSLVVARPGEIDSSVLIRTLEITRDGHATWGTGCGITIDSDPPAEWDEAMLKACPVLGSAGTLLA